MAYENLKYSAIHHIRSDVLAKLMQFPTQISLFVVVVVGHIVAKSCPFHVGDGIKSLSHSFRAE